MEGMETEEVARGGSFLRAPSGDGTRAEGLALNKKTDSFPFPEVGGPRVRGRGWLCRAGVVGARDPEG